MNAPPLLHRAPPLVSQRRAMAALVVLSIATFTICTSEVLPTGLITLMADDLGKTKSEIGLLVTGHALIVTTISIPLAHWTRHIPRRQLLTGTLSLLVVGSLVAGTSHGYYSLLVGRMLTATSQAMFWAVVVATATGLFPPHVRGKAVARLFLGTSACGVLGLPAATWLGQHQGWRAPFFVVAGVGVVLSLAIAILLPSYHPAEGAAHRGSAPSKRRFLVVLGVTAFAILGGTMTYTYITPFFTDVSGFDSRMVPVLLFASGVAGLIAMYFVARVLDRHPRGTMGVALIMLVTGWGCLAAFGTIKTLAASSFCLVGFGMSVLIVSFSNRIMQVSPASTDMGVATHGTVYNAGVALGSLVGAGLLTVGGPRILPMVGATFIAVAFGIWVAEPRFAGRRRER
jgi:predicted MFS family arabinose efflux permease